MPRRPVAPSLQTRADPQRRVHRRGAELTFGRRSFGQALQVGAHAPVDLVAVVGVDQQPVDAEVQLIGDRPVLLSEQERRNRHRGHRVVRGGERDIVQRTAAQRREAVARGRRGGRGLIAAAGDDHGRDGAQRGHAEHDRRQPQRRSGPSQAPASARHRAAYLATPQRSTPSTPRYNSNAPIARTATRSTAPGSSRIAIPAAISATAAASPVRVTPAPSVPVSRRQPCHGISATCAGRSGCDASAATTAPAAVVHSACDPEPAEERLPQGGDDRAPSRRRQLGGDRAADRVERHQHQAAEREAGPEPTDRAPARARSPDRADGEQQRDHGQNPRERVDAAGRSAPPTARPRPAPASAGARRARRSRFAPPRERTAAAGPPPARRRRRR